MDNENIQTQNLGATDTPQAASTIGASDASPFQQSANADALKQNKTIQVAPNGRPITGTTFKSGMSGTAILFLIVSSVVLVMIASSVFRWIMKKPETVKAVKSKKTKVETAKEPVVATVTQPEKSKTRHKKKLSRSKRHK